MTILGDPHQTRPVGGTPSRRLHTGPICRTNSGPLGDMPDEHVYRPYTTMPTRSLHTPAEAFSRARLALKRGRRKFEMWCEPPDPVRRERLIVAGRDDVTRTGYYAQHRGVTLVASDLAGIWRHIQARWPAALEPAIAWQFADFPHWDDDAWCQAWQDVQDRARAAQG